MAIDPELLEILVCPESQGDLELVELPADIRRLLIEKYREHFRDEEPVADQGLYCAKSQLVYPIVSDIPIMLREDALSASVLPEAVTRAAEAGDAGAMAGASSQPAEG